MMYLHFWAQNHKCEFSDGNVACLQDELVSDEMS